MTNILRRERKLYVNWHTCYHANENLHECIDLHENKYASNSVAECHPYGLLNMDGRATYLVRSILPKGQQRSLHINT